MQKLERLTKRLEEIAIEAKRGIDESDIVSDMGSNINAHARYGLAQELLKEARA